MSARTKTQQPRPVEALNKTVATVALILGAIIVLPQLAFCAADVLARNFGVHL